jgi:hypothetical protein
MGRIQDRFPLMSFSRSRYTHGQRRGPKRLLGDRCIRGFFPLTGRGVIKGVSRAILTALMLTCGFLATTATAEWDQECVDWVLSHHCTPPAGSPWGRCCFNDGSCEEMESDPCNWDGGVPSPSLGCAGDQDGNGIDDACECDDFSTACCLPDGTCLQLLPETCEAMGGWPNGWCGSSCPSSCPNPACLAAEGDCAQTHDTPGCDQPNSCDCVCEGLPHCCEEASDVPATSHRGGIVGTVFLLIASTGFLLWRRQATG